MQDGASPEARRETLKKAAGLLRDAGIEFLLAGGYATWARGGREPDDDVDLFLRPGDAEPALDVLAAGGMKPERPPEDWLVKAWDGEVLVDIIFAPAGLPVDDAMFERADELDVGPMRMPVISAGDLMVTRLLAMTEHTLDYESALEVARALREQVDWSWVRDRTTESPFARAFFTLADGLGIVPPAE